MDIIVIEAGHGIGDPGKRSPNPAKYGGPERMFEPEWNREISARLVAMLRENNHDLEVIDLCPGPVNVPIPLSKAWLYKNPRSTRRGYIDTLCTSKNRVIHLSIHANAANGKGWLSPHGARPIIRKDASPESELLSECLHTRMAETSVGNRFKNWTRNTRIVNMGVLKPLNKKRKRLASVMSECGFMTSKSDVKIMNSEGDKQQIVVAHHDAICDFLLELGI